MGSAKLLDHQYGKERVRVLKILRDGATHTVKELAVSVLLSGDFESSYTAADNGKVILTDTMKNTVNSLAKKHLGLETERFSLALANHFIAKYPQVQKAVIETQERVWKRLTVQGAEHAHSFSGDQQSRPTTRVSATAAGAEVSSGVEGLLVLKSTGSGFENYPKDEFTTLPETKDRIFATSLDARWHWTLEPADYLMANHAILAALLAPFALNYSPSVQTTLFQMGEAALEVCAEISSIHLAMPNKHYLPVNLAPFGQDNANEIFLPTDEPHGQIEATIGRA
jgi:urate oxidase